MLLRSLLPASRKVLADLLRGQGRHDEIALIAGAESMIFTVADIEGLWSDSTYSRDSYSDLYPTPRVVAEVQTELGYRLPASYVELCRRHNGGRLRRNCAPAPTRTSWHERYAGVEGIYSIGRQADNSLLGRFGHRFMIEEWGYPEIGLCVADCPSAGHDMVMLDYRGCGPEGEPTVVHVDQEADYRIITLANDFATFVRSLVPEDEVE